MPLWPRKEEKKLTFSFHLFLRQQQTITTFKFGSLPCHTHTHTIIVKLVNTLQKFKFIPFLFLNEFDLDFFDLLELFFTFLHSTSVSLFLDRSCRLMFDFDALFSLSSPKSLSCFRLFQQNSFVQKTFHDRTALDGTCSDQIKWFRKNLFGFL